MSLLSIRNLSLSIGKVDILHNISIDLEPGKILAITGESGSGPSRFKHVIKTNNKYRRLTPIELERLNMFPDNHTKLEGVGNSKRAFLMGNALVVGVVEKIGESLYKKIKNENCVNY